MKMFFLLYLFLLRNIKKRNYVTTRKNMMDERKNIEHQNNIQENFAKIKKAALLSKLIYEYDYISNNHTNTNKQKYMVDVKQNMNMTTNITSDFVEKNNIYFNLVQFIALIDNKDFVKDTEKYFDVLNKKFENSEIYGYFYNKNRLHSLIILNHKYGEIIVVFRGSQYMDEWFKNLCVYETPIAFSPNYKIHKGIYSMYSDKEIDENILYVLKNLFEFFPDYKKIFTGHSKGGVDSILLAFELDCKLAEKYEYEIYTFGNPPIFNTKFANYLHKHPNITIFNVINTDDIICILPFPHRFHIGIEVLLRDNGIFYIYHKKPFKKRFNPLNFFSILNHDLNTYIKNIYNIDTFHNSSLTKE
jgi:hypothetical protein